MAVNFSKVSQIGLVVADLDTAVKNLEKLLGVSVTVRTQTPEGHKLYRGKQGDFCARLAIFDLENIQLELIQPVSGESVWKEFLKKHGSGLHHIQFRSDSYEADKEKLEQQWGALAMEGTSVLDPRIKFGYFDTEDSLNFVLELLNPEERFD